jgi:predicted Zn finger-like uncharacterized protein
MRLICPNCGAQYEVADDVIPPAGRDVQCSNCNHTWFEQPGASLIAEAGDDGISSATPDAPSATTPEPDTPQDATPAGHPEPEYPILAADLEPYDDDGADEPVPPPMPPARTAMRTVSPEIAEILRQEAAREEAARRAEAEAGVETQPDLGLDALIEDEARRADDARRRLARMRGEPVPEAATATSAKTGAAPEAIASDPAPAADVATAVAATVAATRRELLPDIEEINSTLRSATERGAVAVEETRRAAQTHRRGFRLGYGTILLIAAVLGLVYAFAPRITAIVPQSEPFLAPYVAAIDDGRLWLDLKIQGLLTRIEDDAPAQGG